MLSSYVLSRLESFSHVFEYSKSKNFKNIFFVFKFLILINCFHSSKGQNQNLNQFHQQFDQNLCSDYLIDDLISTSVSTFKHLWLTNDRLSNLNRNNLAFIRYMDTWLRRDGAPNTDEELKTYSCADFGKKRIACQYEIKKIAIKHTFFDGINLHIFLQNEFNHEWRVVVMDANSGNLIYFDVFKNCLKRRKKSSVFYKQFFCDLNKYLNLDDVKSLLMMNIDLTKDLDQSPFEVWCFFKNETMKKIRFHDRNGKNQLINLSLNSFNGISIASVQFMTGEFVAFNWSALNPFARQQQKRSIMIDKKNLINNHVSNVNNSINSISINSTYINSTLINSTLINHQIHQNFNHKLERSKRSFFNFNSLRSKRIKRSARNRKKHHRKHRKKCHNKNCRKKKAIDLHLNRLVTGLSAYLNSFNLTMDSVLSKLISIKSKAAHLFFPYKQNQVIVFHKHYSTYHHIEENFFVQLNPLPFVQPNQVFFGCPQPYCFLTTIDDLTYNYLTDELLIFRNQYYWNIKINDKQTTKQKPYIQIDYPRVENAKLISNDNQNDLNFKTESDFPKEFPMYIDAITYIDYENFNYLIAIKDGWVFIYIPNNKKLVPLLFTDYFETSMPLSRVDTIFSYGRQLFVFSGSHYWVYDLITDLKLRLNNRGIVFRNLPHHLDASFVFRNKFYFFKQNFFYLNDPKGQSIIRPQLVHDTFLKGCQFDKLPSDIQMSKIFKAPSLINYYCMRCEGYIIEGLKDKWNINDNKFVTVESDDTFDRENIDRKTKFNINKKTTIPTAWTHKIPDLKRPILSDIELPDLKQPIFPDIELPNENKVLTSEKLMIIPHDQITTIKSNDLENNDLGNNDLEKNEMNDKNKLSRAMAKLDDFVLNLGTLITHHVLFGFLLVLIFILTIYFCQQAREQIAPKVKRDDLKSKLKGKSRRKEMMRRNRRWN